MKKYSILLILASLFFTSQSVLSQGISQKEWALLTLQFENGCFQKQMAEPTSRIFYEASIKSVCKCYGEKFVEETRAHKQFDAAIAKQDKFLLQKVMAEVSDAVVKIFNQCFKSEADRAGGAKYMLKEFSPSVEEARVGLLGELRKSVVAVFEQQCNSEEISRKNGNNGGDRRKFVSDQCSCIANFIADNVSINHLIESMANQGSELTKQTINGAASCAVRAR